MLQVISYIVEKHHKQKRMGGAPYVSHPIEVAKILESKGLTGDILYVGLLHDILEDTVGTPLEILSMTNQSVLDDVILLTKVKGVSTEEYLGEIMKSMRARLAKLADRLHNLQSAFVASSEFQARYIKETETYYIPLAKGTVFEQDIAEALFNLKQFRENKNKTNKQT